MPTEFGGDVVPQVRARRTRVFLQLNHPLIPDLLQMRLVRSRPPCRGDVNRSTDAEYFFSEHRECPGARPCETVSARTLVTGFELESGGIVNGREWLDRTRCRQNPGRKLLGCLILGAEFGQDAWVFQQ